MMKMRRDRHERDGLARRAGRTALACALAAILAFAARPAEACSGCLADSIEHGIPTDQQISMFFQQNMTRAREGYEQMIQRTHITEEFAAMEKWIMDMLDNYLVPATYEMTEQFSTAGLWNATVVGTYFDAEIDSDTQIEIQKLEAEAYRDYRPSVDMCVFGTVTRSLGAAQALGEQTLAVLDQWAIKREMGSVKMAAADGEQQDRPSRLEQMRRRYCDSMDNGNYGLLLLCFPGVGTNKQGQLIQASGQTIPPPPITVNKDIDYAETMEGKMTLDLDLNPQLNAQGQPPTRESDFGSDGEDILALASNLYAHKVFFRVPNGILQSASNRQRFLDLRSVAAKRSVAEASFFSIASLRVPGSPPQQAGATPDAAVGSSQDTAQYFYKILSTLGWTDTKQITYMVGVRPSYYAQMEMLTKKIYQDPRFYTNLYDTPANTARKKVAMQAIGLIQDYDTLQSYLRTELMLSVLLETEIMKLQETVQNRIQTLLSEGRNG
jgi:hypothetical protein